MSGTHPTDRNLAAFIDGRLAGEAADLIRSHVSDCARCQLRVGAANEGAALDTHLPAADVLKVNHVEESAVEAPAPGDVWRLAWDTTPVLAVIWSVDVDRISVMPIVESADADEWTALLSAERTGGLGPLAISVALETTVPWSVLDARITGVDDSDGIASLRSAFRSGTPTSTRRGEAVRSALDDRLVGLEQIAETFNELANAVWAPISAQTETKPLDFDTLSDAGIAVNRSLALVRGAVPSNDEADVIESATGVRPDIGPVDDELRRKIDQPRRKAMVRARARANQRSEAAERLALARDAQPALAAARGTKGAPPDYDTILDRLLDA